ncbi:hypothetical protein LPJ53_004583 [Coemansia erecta]|uniref:HMG box domain-containing protein n=1 Tax=Coemansia erecta TaxID=147472 RepID=A0A9W8CPN0_9FUNG|nr:hypothetical protein LPJ53_004583 [Coemansia erecta]
MDGYQNYPQYGHDQYHSPAPVQQHMVYPHMNGMQVMPPMANPHMVNQMMPSYPSVPPTGNRKQPITRASHVISEPACQVYRADETAEAIEFTTRQLIAFDGKVFIEHLPGHNIIFAPIQLHPHHVLHPATASSSSTSRVSKLRLKSKKLNRPKNVFFKYRSKKVKELQEQYPKLNQTVISKLAAEHWHNETPEVKEQYRKIYQDEMAQYELDKKISRIKGNRSHSESSEVEDDGSSLVGGSHQLSSESNRTVVSNDYYYSVPQNQHPSPLGITQSPPMEMARQRSFSYPVDPKQQSDINNLIH